MSAKQKKILPISLASLQQNFASALVDPGNLEPALALFRGSPLQVENRLALYRGNLSRHWEKALADIYPVLQAQLGDKFFFGMGRVYGRRYPSVSGDLHGFGAFMPEFLRQFEPVQAYPWLPDLAELEWTMHQAHFAADVDAFDPSCIAALTPETMDSVRLSLRPGCTLRRFAWDVETLWQAHQQEPVSEWREHLQMPVTVLIYRTGWRVRVRALDCVEAAAMTVLAAGATVGSVLEAVLAANGEAGIAVLFVRWLSDELLQQTDVPPAWRPLLS